ERILEAERSIVTQGPARDADTIAPGRRSATIVRVVDGEVHYYSNGAETVRIVVLRRSAGFNPDNVQVYVDAAGGMKHVQIADVRGAERGPTPKGLSSDAVHYLRQSLGLIQLHLSGVAR